MPALLKPAKVGVHAGAGCKGSLTNVNTAAKPPPPRDLAPDDPPANDLVARAEALAEAGQYDAAAAVFERALKAGGPNRRAHTGLARLARRAGDVDWAIHHFGQALALEPTALAELNTLAELLFDVGRVGEAVAVLEQGLARHQPSAALVPTLCNLALCRAAEGRLRTAFDVLARAATLDPRDPQPLADAVPILIRLSRIGEAEAWHARLTTLAPDHPQRHALAARLHLLRGDAVAADAAVQAGFKSKGDRVALSIQLADVALALDRAAGAVDRVERALAQCRDPENLSALHVRLGHLHDRLGAVETAFSHVAEANAVRARGVRFDDTALTADTTAMIEAFAPERHASLARSSAETELPVFIVGMPRSGTSLVEQILDSHPHAAGAGELTDIAIIARDLPAVARTAVPYPACMAQVTAEHLDAIVARHLPRLQALGPGARRVSDKLPTNFRHLGLIRCLYPKATILHCVRDPVDTCLSCFFQDFQATLPEACDLAALAGYYGQYRRLMQHWQEDLKLPIVDIRYEALVAEPEAETRRLIAACGLAWDDACLRFFENKRVVNTASVQQVRKPIYTGSVQRWRRYEKHVGPLLDGLRPYL